ncbi:MAG: TadE/TadG family type IV pilus assembly protein [Luteimonas sp.]
MTGPSGQRGQALTEMAICAVILVPLVLLIPLLGKYAHIQQTIQQAARAAAWQATAVEDYVMETLDAGQQQALLVDRHFGHADDPITTAVEPADDGRLRGTMFNTHSDQPLVEPADIQLDDYLLAEQTDLTGQFLGLLPDWLPGGFPPSRNGMVTARLQLSPQNLRYSDGSPVTAGTANWMSLAPFDSIDLRFQASHTLLADPWGAAGSGINENTGGDRPRTAYQQVRTLVPTTNFSFIGDWMDNISGLDRIPILGVPLRLRVGYAQDVMDVVPEDRLQEYPGS